MRLVLATALTLALPTGLLAAGSNNEAAPTKPKCEEGQVYDKKTKTCVDAKDSRLDDDSRFETVRQLSHAGRYADAQTVLAEMDAQDDRTLTYMGFTSRKMGDMDGGMALYAQALAVNPANALARSYMGQALVEQGRIAEALVQLREIRSHGGGGTWAETSLRTAIATGQTYTY